MPYVYLVLANLLAAGLEVEEFTEVEVLGLQRVQHGHQITVFVVVGFEHQAFGHSPDF